MNKRTVFPNTNSPTDLPQDLSEGRANFPEGSARPSGTFPVTRSSLTEHQFPSGCDAGSTEGQRAPVSIWRRLYRNPVAEIFGDVIGAACLFVILFGGLWIGEILK